MNPLPRVTILISYCQHEAVVSFLKNGYIPTYYCNNKYAFKIKSYAPLKTLRVKWLNSEHIPTLCKLSGH